MNYYIIDQEDNIYFQVINRSKILEFVRPPGFGLYSKVYEGFEINGIFLKDVIFKILFLLQQLIKDYPYNVWDDRKFKIKIIEDV